MSEDILFRPGTWDENIWRSVVEQNEYGLPDRFDPADVVLDVGAHVGAFAYACLDRGAGLVVCVEPDTDNANYLRHNLHSACRAQHRSVLVTAAAWRSDRPAGPLHYAAVGQNTGGGNTLGDTGQPVLGVPLDLLLELAAGLSPSGRLRLVKMDCEGAEWPCLYSSRRLGLADEVVGEYHTLPAGVYPDLAVAYSRVPEGTPGASYACDAAGLEAFFRGWMRWDCRVTPTGGGLGKFHARLTALPFAPPPAAGR